MKTVVLLLLYSIFLCGAPRMQIHMGTMISVTTESDEMAKLVFDEFAKLDQMLSTYKDDSEISQLNRNLILEVSDPTYEVLKRSLQMSQLSLGAFDVTIGGMSERSYGFGREEKIPTQNELRQEQRYTGQGKLSLIGHTAMLAQNSRVDLGGIGKGFAVDRSIQLLLEHNVSRAIIAASGDIGCIGGCSIQIQDPFHPDGVIGEIVSSNKRLAVSTSGNYERYIKNKKYNHLLDPKTGKPQQRYASITLIDDEDNTRIDALATAVAVMEEKSARTMLDSLKISYILIRNDGSMVKSTMAEGIRVTLVTEENSKKR